MTPQELKDARATLGLTQSGLASVLLMGKGARRTVRRWEKGDITIPGPVEIAVLSLVACNDTFLIG